MGFWIFMFICNLILPLMMIIFGGVFRKCPPRDINGLYGYRTSRSMKNQNTWDFAQKCFGELWWKLGWILLIPSALVMLPCMGNGDGVTGWVGGICMLVQCVLLIAAIFPVERELKKKFDENGKEKL